MTRQNRHPSVKQMKLLAIDAATEGCSVALSVDGDILTRYIVTPRGHSQRLLGMVDEVLTEAGIKLSNLDGLVFDRGPGSFTGVRISTSVCQGLAFGADLPVVAVSSLAALAQGALRTHGTDKVLAAIDARMGEIYAGWYQQTKGIMQPIQAEWIGKADQLPDLGHDWFGAGTGWGTYQIELSQHTADSASDPDNEALPHAQDLLALAIPEFESGKVLKPEQALPTYLRNQVTNVGSGL